MIKTVKKREGVLVAYDREKIAGAIWGAIKAVGGTDPQLAQKLAALAVEYNRTESPQ